MPVEGVQSRERQGAGKCAPATHCPLACARGSYRHVVLQLLLDFNGPPRCYIDGAFDRPSTRGD